MAKKQKAALKRWTVWYDPNLEDYYVVLRVYRSRITILWLYTDKKPCTIDIIGCFGDKFIKILSPLERELL